jgi:hypothetical protein
MVAANCRRWRCDCRGCACRDSIKAKEKVMVPYHVYAKVVEADKAQNKLYRFIAGRYYCNTEYNKNGKNK